MNRENKWFTQIVVFLLWALSSALGLWMLVAARQSFLVRMVNLYVKDDIVRGWQARFFDNVFFIIAGLVGLIGVFLIERYFRDGIREDVVKCRAARLFGVELSILFIFNLVTLIVGGSVGGTLSTLMLIGEGILGGGLYAFSVISKRKLRRGQT